MAAELPIPARAKWSRDGRIPAIAPNPRQIDSQPAPQPVAATTPDRIAVFRVEAWSKKKGKSWSAEIRITSIDPATGKITGEMEWPSLSTVNVIEGRWQGNRLTFTETAHLRGSSAHVNVTYELEVKGAALSGSWTEPGKDAGTITPR